MEPQAQFLQLQTLMDVSILIELLSMIEFHRLTLEGTVTSFTKMPTAGEDGLEWDPIRRVILI